MDRRRTIFDCFPNRREQTVVMAVLMVGFAAMMIALIYVGSKHDGLRDIDDTSASQTIRFVVNINEADWFEIAQLPDIGPTMSRRIIAYRDSHGLFQTIDELKAVKGIGEKTFTSMMPHITVGADGPDIENTPQSLARRP